MPTLGDRIKTERERRAWTQRDLAARAEVSPTAIYLWETGQRQPKLRLIRRLATAFGMPVEVFVAGTEDTLDTSTPPVEVWAALHWPADLVRETVEDWPDYSEAERLDIIRAAYDVYERQQALQAKVQRRNATV